MPPYVEPKFAKKLYRAQNPDASTGKHHKLGTSATKDNSLDGGICCAMCLLWFKRIFQTNSRNVDWALTDDARAAKSIFLQYMMVPHGGTALDREMALYTNHGMTLHGENSKSEDRYSGNILRDAGLSAENWIKMTPELTCFSLGVAGHAMGGFWKKGEAYFFDPNEGIFQFTDINDFAEEVPDCIYQNYLKGTEDSYLFFYKVTKGVS